MTQKVMYFIQGLCIKYFQILLNVLWRLWKQEAARQSLIDNNLLIID